MEQHVKIIGIIDIVLGVLAILFGIIMVVGFMIGAAAVSGSGDPDAGPIAAIMASVGLAGGILVIALGAFQIFVGVKLQALKSWARVVQIILAFLQLLNIPLGTAFGVYSLWAMFNKETAALFDE